MQQNKNNICARCCQSLDLAQARWNYVFWGMAHRKCTADAVWPPKFRPSLDPNEVLRQISALCAHLAKLSQLSGVPSELPIPQTLPFARLSETTQSAMTSSSPEIVGTEPTREEKTEAAVPAERAKTQVGRKRREQPVATPRQTPPPRPKRPPPTKLRLMMKTTSMEKSARTPFAYKYGEAGGGNA